MARALHGKRVQLINGHMHRVEASGWQTATTAGTTWRRSCPAWASAAGPGASRAARIRRMARALHRRAGPAGQRPHAQGGGFRPGKGDPHRGLLEAELPRLLIGHRPGTPRAARILRRARDAQRRGDAHPDNWNAFRAELKIVNQAAQFFMAMGVPQFKKGGKDEPTIRSGNKTPCTSMKECIVYLDGPRNLAL
jgi:hypothetical protein